MAIRIATARIALLQPAENWWICPGDRLAGQRIDQRHRYADHAAGSINR
jgi:hypothetical protein